MKNRLVKLSTSEPSDLAHIEAIVAIGEVVINFVSLGDLKDVQDKNVNNELGQHDHCREHHVVLQVILADFVVLSDFSLVRENHNEEQSEWDQEKALSLTGVRAH